MGGFTIAIAPWTAWVGELIGLSALIAVVLFAATYQANADWKSTRPGRAIMYLARGLAATITLLILTGFIHFGEWRWVAEVVVYTPMAWACWNLYFSLRHQLGMEPRYLFRVRPKDISDLFDTQP
ncbi:putative phage holin [Agrococcus sp. DT81.2]|uniref:putative phage holin n=1 Tax=Agrococcus sp. DT81.2 TaxID=3393414 RepID=UPI003CE4D8E8